MPLDRRVFLASLAATAASAGGACFAGAAGTSVLDVSISGDSSVMPPASLIVAAR